MQAIVVATKKICMFINVLLSLTLIQLFYLE